MLIIFMIFNWNFRGAVKDFPSMVKDLIRLNNVKILVICEPGIT